MTKRLLYISTLIFFSACTAEDDPIVVPETQPDVPIYMVPDVERMSAETRAFSSKDNFQIETDIIGFYALQTVETEANRIEPVAWQTSRKFRFYNNTPYYFNSDAYCLSTLNGKSTMFPGTSRAALKFFAYYPYNENVANDETTNAPLIPVGITGDNSNQTDYLYTIAELTESQVKAATSDIVLEFKHALCRLKFVVDPGSNEYTSTFHPTITKITVITNETQNGYMSFTSDSLIFKSDGTGLNTFQYIPEEPYKVYNGTGSTLSADFLFLPNADSDVVRQILVSGIDEYGNTFTDKSIFNTTIKADKGKTKMSPGCIYTLKIVYALRITPTPGDGDEGENSQSIDMWVEPAESDTDYNKEITIDKSDSEQ